MNDLRLALRVLWGVLRGQHVYWSTGCFHGKHDYCASMTGQAGSKRPAECKFCQAACICWCHA